MVYLEYGSASVIYVVPRIVETEVVHVGGDTPAKGSSGQAVSLTVSTSQNSSNTELEYRAPKENGVLDFQYCYVRTCISDLKAADIGNVTIVAHVTGITEKVVNKSGDRSLVLGLRDHTGDMCLFLRGDVAVSGRRLKIGQPVIVHKLRASMYSSEKKILYAACGESKSGFICALSELTACLRSLSLFPHAFLADIIAAPPTAEADLGNCWVVRGLVSNVTAARSDGTCLAWVHTVCAR